MTAVISHSGVRTPKSLDHSRGARLGPRSPTLKIGSDEAETPRQVPTAFEGMGIPCLEALEDCFVRNPREKIGLLCVQATHTAVGGEVMSDADTHAVCMDSRGCSCRRLPRSGGIKIVRRNRNPGARTHRIAERSRRRVGHPTSRTLDEVFLKRQTAGGIRA